MKVLLESYCFDFQLPTYDASQFRESMYVAVCYESSICSCKVKDTCICMYIVVSKT